MKFIKAATFSVLTYLQIIAYGNEGYKSVYCQSIYVTFIPKFITLKIANMHRAICINLTIVSQRNIEFMDLCLLNGAI